MSFFSSSVVLGVGYSVPLIRGLLSDPKFTNGLVLAVEACSMLVGMADFPIKFSPNFKRRESFLPHGEHFQGQRADEMGCRFEVRHSGAS